MQNRNRKVLFSALTRYDNVKTQSDMQTNIIIYVQYIQFKWITSFLFISTIHLIKSRHYLFLSLLVFHFVKKILGNFLIENHFKNHVLLINQYFVVHSPLFKFFERVHHIFSLCTASFISTT